MEDVARDVTRMPPQFVAHGVDYEGGIYNKAMPSPATHTILILLKAGGCI